MQDLAKQLNYSNRNLDVNTAEGFSLIELVVVVAVLAALAAIAFPSFQSLTKRAAFVVAKSTLLDINRQCKINGSAQEPADIPGVTWLRRNGSLCTRGISGN